MIITVDSGIDVVSLAIGVGVSFFAFQIRDAFRGGILWKPWKFIAPAPLLFAVAQAAHIAAEVYGFPVAIELVHGVFLFGFLLLLFYGFYLFSKVWTTKKD